MVTQLARENAWPKGLVSANIDTSEENDESHSGIMRASCLPCQPTLPTFPPCPGSCGSPLAQRPARWDTRQDRRLAHVPPRRGAL